MKLRGVCEVHTLPSVLGTITMRKILSFLCASIALLALPAFIEGAGIFEHSLKAGRAALEADRLGEAEEHIERALLRDPKSAAAWQLRAAWAEKKQDNDELVYALHQELRLRRAQKAPSSETKALSARITSIDPIAAELFKLRDKHLDKLLKIALAYEKDGRPHSAIRAFRQLLSIEPESPEAEAAIERISARPDPSLAETARPKDLLADVSVDWIRDHDEKHTEWKTRAKMVRDNYVTQTDAGYEVLVRTAEAMEQMNRFYRRFFHYADDVEKGGVPRIDVLIFKNRDEYLKLGSGPPVDWSGGQFTGGSVETYIGEGGFEEMTTTLFHEAAHQFVSLATSASGWLNEGLASFFEGTRILANGTVVMNMPANHRLFPLVKRMNVGWMADHLDGLDPKNTSQEPEKAPTFGIVLANKYAWGPPWYAPTWGVVFFLYNYQDPADGRFVYRSAFREFINRSSGVGEGAIRNFEEIVLANPQKATAGYDGKSDVELPKTTEELDVVWKKWMNALADEQSGKLDIKRPYLEWARCALLRGENEIASEHFEKGLISSPDDVPLLEAFATHLLENEKNPDRASKLALQALVVLEHAEKKDDKSIDRVEDLLGRCDPKRAESKRLLKDIAKSALDITQRYADNGFPLMAMDMASRLGTELQVPELFAIFEKAARDSGKSVARWQLAYNEQDLKGWAAASGQDVWTPYGMELVGHLGKYDPENFDYSFMTYDKVTSGDFSFEVEVSAQRKENVFCGIVFGRKSAQTFHQLVLYPGHEADPTSGKIARADKIAFATMFGSDASKEWQAEDLGPGRQGWHKLRVDVTGMLVDIWVDDEYVTTQEFESPDVLRGSFGLITGCGTCRFRNLRFQARDRYDLGASIERKIRIGEIQRKTGSGARNGRWLGKLPPFFALPSWLKGEPCFGFQELGSKPKLLVFFSIEQNEKIRIDEWLMDLEKRTRDIDLEIIALAHYQDAAALPAYLTTHPFPGRVGVDRKSSDAGIMGDWFEGYFIPKWKMPRLVLLDVDDLVEWEGNPQLVAGKPWQVGEPTYFDDPLESFIQKRKLRELKAFRENWNTRTKLALEAGDFDAALPELKKALTLSNRASEVAQAQRFWNAVRASSQNAGRLAADVTAANAEPALKILIEWSTRMDTPLGRDVMTQFSKALNSQSVKDWDSALKKIDAVKPKLSKGDPTAALTALNSELAKLSGRFVVELRSELAEALAAGNVDLAKRLVEEARRRPARWWMARFAET